MEGKKESPIKAGSIHVFMHTFDEVIKEIIKDYQVEGIQRTPVDEIKHLVEFKNDFREKLQELRSEIECGLELDFCDDDLITRGHINYVIDPQLSASIKKELPDHDEQELLWYMAEEFYEKLKNLDNNPELKKIFTNMIEDEKKDYEEELKKENE